jgi:hypothetical protein
MNYFKFESTIEIRASKCEENIIKNMKLYNVIGVIPSSWSWLENFQNILDDATKINSAIGGIDQGV